MKIHTSGTHICLTNLCRGSMLRVSIMSVIVDLDSKGMVLGALLSID